MKILKSSKYFGKDHDNIIKTCAQECAIIVMKNTFT